jgi:hypothetical protein
VTNAILKWQPFLRLPPKCVKFQSAPIYEGTESADIATNENILLLDEYWKVKLFEYLLH